jgi:hypothetical protein
MLVEGAAAGYSRNALLNPRGLAQQPGSRYAEGCKNMLPWALAGAQGTREVGEGLSQSCSLVAE